MVARCAGLALLMALVPFPWAGAQSVGSTTGAVSGEIVGPSGEAIQGARVAISDAAAGVERQLLSDPQGRFVALALPTGRYSLEVWKEGYTSVLIEDVGLELGELLRLHVALRAGRSGSLTATSAPLLDVSSASRVASLSVARLEEGVAAPSVARPTGHRAAETLAILPNVDVLPATVGVGAARSSLLDVAGEDGRRTVFRVQGLQIAEAVALPLIASALDLAAETRAQSSGAAVFDRSEADAAIDLVPGPLRRTRLRVDLGYAPRSLAGATRKVQGQELGSARASDATVAVAGRVVPEHVWGSLGALGGAAKEPWLTLDGRSGLLDRREGSAVARTEVRARRSWRFDIGALASTRRRELGSLDADVEDLDWRGFSLATDLLAGSRVAVRGFLGSTEVSGRTPSAAGSLIGVLPSEPAIAIDRSTDQERIGLELQLPAGHRLQLGLDRRRSDERPSGSDTRRVTSRRAAWFVRDLWQPAGRWTLDLGLRAEEQTVDLRGRGAIELGAEDTLSPRLGLAYDVLGDGNYAIYTHVGWYRQLLTDDVPVEVLELGGLSLAGQGRPGTVFEAVLGARQLIVPGLVVSAELGYRRQQQVLRLPLAPEDGEQLASALVGTGRSTGSLLLAGDGTLRPWLSGDLLRLPGVEVLSAEVAADVRLAPRWSLAGSYRYAAFGAAPDSVVGTTGASALARANAGLVSPFGAGAWRHRVELSGEYRFSGGFSLGALASFHARGLQRDWIPITAAAVIPGGGLPPAGAKLSSTIVEHGRDRGAVSELDVALRYRFGASDRHWPLVVSFEVFNLLDQVAALARWASPFQGPIAVASGVPPSREELEALAQLQGVPKDPRFGEPTRLQAPRAVRLGLKLSF